MLTLTEKWKDSLWRTGLVLLLIQAVVFALPLVLDIKTNGLFIIHGLIALLYFVALLFSGRLKKGQNGLPVLWLFLIIFLVSAYALNREIPVFESATGWMCWLLVISCINYATFYFFENMPRWVQKLQLFILGISIPFYTYLSLYLLPLSGIGILAAIGLGISLHAFVPLLFVIYSVVLIKRLHLTHMRYLPAFATGAAVAIITTVVFVTMWCTSLSRINGKYGDVSIEGNSALPAWVNTARTLPQNAVTEKMLKSGLVYQTGDAGSLSFFSFPSRSFSEQRKHDPLVMTASFLGGIPHMPEDDRIKVLEAMYQSRHQAQERLWIGDHLVTGQVDTKVAIWPAFRMSYTELGIVVANTAPAHTWEGQQEEAIYSFQLPEGSVVTSLSLWVNGKEEKGMLTTVSKADSAYKTIVGVQRRDPSVVHWQEGNMVTVRVFPVLDGERRKFKMGVTSPLELYEGRLQYRSVYFKGPDWSHAKATTTVQFTGAVAEVNLPYGFARVSDQTYTCNGSYRGDWGLDIRSTDVSGEAFAFEGRAWHLEPFVPLQDTATFTRVYLDVNEAWTKEECEAVYEAVKDKKVYVTDERDVVTKITAENKTALFTALRKARFSLFPFFKIKEGYSALVVTKGTLSSPQLRDLKGHAFLEQLRGWFAGGRRVKLFNIGNTLSPYLRTLKEFRAFDYAAGSATRLSALMRSGKFVVSTETEGRIELPEAGMVIVQSDSALAKVTGAAPDHLMRLFAYNHILQKAGTALLAGEEVPEPVITEAGQAYVVSPASSLIVLETQQDYEKFDIKASKNSLQNAQHQATGSVPEPHEWALIIIVLLLLLHVVYRPLPALIRSK